ncbi:MAG: hypothetical protein PVJ39_20250 [Gammaproteobacteria bacterium]
MLTGVDDTAKLPFWEWRTDVVSLRFVQRLPDQTRAFFMARGFGKQHAEQIAQSCIFQTVYKNISIPSAERIITYDMADWEVIHHGQSRRVKTREQWVQQWQNGKISQASLIAFEWSLLPSRQRYQAKDYNWGMISFNLPPGSTFDLLFRWAEDGKQKSARIKGIECAPDVHPDPKESLG